MIGAERSLLSFLDAPVVVGDPDGRCVHVNPAFEERFGCTARSAAGVPLGELFAGGARESVLRAVARVVAEGGSVRFPVREGGSGWSAVASPIEAAGDRVGVVILFKEDLAGTERLLAIQREIRDPLGEIQAALESLLEQTGGRRDQRFRTEIEDALRAMARVHKWFEELGRILGGEAASDAPRWRPARVLRHVAAHLAQGGSPLRGLSLLVPLELPEAAGDPTKVESVLLRLVRERAAADPAPESLTLGARAVARGERRVVLVSLTERGGGGEAAPAALPPLLAEVVAAAGGRIQALADPELGRVTLLAFPAPEAAAR